jgi:probable rRNA maturation factor
MTFKLTVSNQQKSLSVSEEFLQKMGKKLIKKLIDNLANSPSKQVSKKCLAELSRRGIISLSLVNNSQIRKLNKRFCKKDKATDVLSFPLTLVPTNDKFPFELGEIIISAEKAVQQAKMYGHSVERELAFLFVHGCLHILGFDHKTKKEEKDMFGRQAQILDAAGFKR